jgi:hypothetical protein
MPVTIICKNCGEETEIIPSKLNITKFCCKECWKEYLVTHPVNRHAARKYERGAEVHRKPGKKRPADGRCVVCHCYLNPYNMTDQCDSHSVVDREQNIGWTPDGVKGGVQYSNDMVW